MMMLNKRTFALKYGHCNTPGDRCFQIFGSPPILMTWRDALPICLCPPPNLAHQHILNEACLKNGARQIQEASGASQGLGEPVSSWRKMTMSRELFVWASEPEHKPSPPRSGGPGSRLRLLRLWKDLHTLVSCGVAEVHSSFLLHWSTCSKL